MELEVITANNAEDLKQKIYKFKKTSMGSSYYHRFHLPQIENISITTNGVDYIATIQYYIRKVE